MKPERKRQTVICMAVFFFFFKIFVYLFIYFWAELRAPAGRRRRGRDASWQRVAVHWRVQCVLGTCVTVKLNNCLCWITDSASPQGNSSDLFACLRESFTWHVYSLCLICHAAIPAEQREAPICLRWSLPALLHAVLGDKLLPLIRETRDYAERSLGAITLGITQCLEWSWRRSTQSIRDYVLVMLTLLVLLKPVSTTRCHIRRDDEEGT